jgi:hypothetical protein
MYDDRQKWGSEITTEASDIYNVYYPVMEAQVVTDNNGKAFISYKSIYTQLLSCCVCAAVVCFTELSGFQLYIASNVGMTVKEEPVTIL